MSFTFELARQAVAAKGALATGMRSANTNPEVLTPMPSMRVAVPSYTLRTQPQAWTEEYTLTFPFEVLVERPAGRKVSQPTVIGLMRALQVEWRRTFQLPSLEFVLDSYIETMTPGLTEYAETGFDGFSGSIVVTIDETLTTARTGAT